MNKKMINYIMYGLLALVGIVLLVMFASSDDVIEPTNKEPVEELVITTNTINLSVGETSQIGVTVQNINNVNYLSTNSSIAKVSSTGLVEGVSNGTAYIIVNYVTSTNASYTKQVIVNVSGGVEISSVSLPTGELLMKVNDTFNLPVTITPDTVDRSKLSYLVSNKSIVVVDESGNVKALSPGIAAIRATAKENINADILVRVVENENVVPQIVVMPEKISAIKNVTLKVGEEKQLSYMVEPTDAYMDNSIWKSSNSGIVTVDNGKVVGVSQGDAVVTLKTVNDMELKINVSVKPSVVEVTSLKVNSSSNLTLKVGETSQITYQIKPDDATDKTVSFQSSNTSVANVNEKGLITAVGSGTASITATSANQLKTFNVIVTVKKEESSSTPSNPSTGTSCKGDSHVGTIDSSLLTSPTEDGFDKCKSRSRNLVPYINGTNYGQDGLYVMHVGETLTVNLKLPTMCGKIDTLTRTNHDGASGWSEYVSQSSSPKVNRNDSNTYVSGVDGYTWKITAKKKGCITLSQTAQFDVTSPKGRRGNMKSMIRLKVRIVD